MRTSDAVVPNTPGVRSDVAGIAVSVGCAIHCAAVPILWSAAPIAAAAIASRWVHVALLAALLPVAGVALVRGYRAHRRPRAAFAAAAGAWVLACVAFFEWRGACCAIDASSSSSSSSAHPWVTSIGSALIVVGHVWNLRDGVRLVGGRTR